jgi:hypothetical protein
MNELPAMLEDRMRLYEPERKTGTSDIPLSLGYNTAARNVKLLRAKELMINLLSTYSPSKKQRQMA